MILKLRFFVRSTSRGVGRRGGVGKQNLRLGALMKESRKRRAKPNHPIEGKLQKENVQVGRNSQTAGVKIRGGDGMKNWHQKR